MFQASERLMNARNHKAIIRIRFSQYIFLSMNQNANLIFDAKCGQIKHHLISINPISLALRKLEIEKKVIR